MARALAPFYFQPGTPGAPQNRNLLRSHGSAMLGIYAEAAVGQTLRARGVPVLASASPFPVAATLVAPGIRVSTTGVDPAYCLSRCAADRELSCAFCPRLGTVTEVDTDFRKLNSGSSPAAAIVGAVAARLLSQGYREPMQIKAILN